MSKISVGISFIILLLMVAGAGAVSIGNVMKLDIPETDIWDTVLSPDGTKIAYVAYDDAQNQQIFSINADGTGKTKLTDDDLKKWGLAWGRNKIAYVSYGKDGLEKIFVMNQDGTENMQLIPDDTRQGNPTDDKGPAWAAPSWSPDGNILIYTSLDETSDPKMYMVNADGTGKKPVFKDNFKQWSPSISPDGKNIVYVSYNEKLNQDLFIVEIGGITRRQLTFDGLKTNYPKWGPDATIVYVSYENVTSSGERIFAINQDGTGKRLFLDWDYRQLSPGFSMDGRKFSYVSTDIKGVDKIAVGDVAGITITPLVTVPAVLTPVVTETAPTEPMKTETPPAGSLNDILLTMAVVLGIIVVLMLVLLLISGAAKKK